MSDLTVVEGAGNGERFKTMVLDSVSSPIPKPAYKRGALGVSGIVS